MYFIPKSARDVVTHPSPLSISAILGQKVNMLSYGSVQYASPFPTPKATSNMVMNKKVRTSVALAREGLLGKACQVLTSSGVVPSNNDTWELLQSKHPGPWDLVQPHEVSQALLRSLSQFISTSWLFCSPFQGQ